MKIIGHRGARGLAPSNTMASVEKALEHKVDQVEVDLRVTKDDVVILHHDIWLRDRSGKTLLVKNNSYADLKRHKPDLATLEELLEHGTVSLYLEVKHWEKVQPIARLLKKYPGRDVAIGSKSQKTLLELHAALPDIPKIVIHPWSGLLATMRAKQVGTTLISMNQWFLWSGFIKLMSKRGYRLTAYPLNNPVKARRWEKHGLYGVVTDLPNRFKL